MNIENIVDSAKHLLNNRITTFDTSFYKRCAEYLNDQEKVHEFKKTREISNPLLTEPLRLYVDSMFDNFVCFITDMSVLKDQTKGPIIRKDSMIRDLSFLSKKARDNLLRQLYVIETDNLDNFIDPDSAMKNYPKIEEIVFVIASNRDNKFNMEIVIDDVNFIRIKNRSSLHLFMGSEVLRFLEKQNLDRFVDYMKSDEPHVVKSMNMFKQIYKMSKDLISKPDVRDRTMLFSGFVMHSLGTSYTGDADVMYWGKNRSVESLEDDRSIFSNYDKVELFVYDETDNNVDYVGDLITNPDKHYYFVGIKILCIKSYLRRLYQRGSPSSFVDLIMLNRINGIHITPCFPVITVDGDSTIIYTKKTVEKKLRIVQKYFKDWHNIDYPMDEIRGMIKQCKNYPNDPPFYRSIRSDPVTQTIEYILHNIVLVLMNRHFVSKDKGSDLDKGSNLLIIDDAKEYPKYYPSKKSNMRVVVIEPYSSTTTKIFMKMTDKYLSKKKHKNNDTMNQYTMIQGDIKRDNEFNKFPEISDVFRYVMFRYNMCFMMNQIDTVIDNLRNRCTDDAVMMILYVDGDYVEDLMRKTDRFEEMDTKNDTTIFGVYRYDDQVFYPDEDDRSVKSKYKQIVVYLRETLRYGHGVVERLTKTKDILDAFGSNYHLIKDEPMIQCDDAEIKSYVSELSDQQKRIATVFRYMILQAKYN